MRGTAGDQRPAFPFYRAFMLLGIPFYSRWAELRLKWAIGFRLPDSTAAAFVDDCTIRLYKLGIETLRTQGGIRIPFAFDKLVIEADMFANFPDILRPWLHN